jgi:hypothetical protein
VQGVLGAAAEAGFRFFTYDSTTLSTALPSLSQPRAAIFLEAGVKYTAQVLIAGSNTAPGVTIKLDLSQLQGIAGGAFATGVGKAILTSAALGASAFLPLEATVEVTTSGWYVPRVVTTAPTAAGSTTNIFLGIS